MLDLGLLEYDTAALGTTHQQHCNISEDPNFQNNTVRTSYLLDCVCSLTSTVAVAHEHMFVVHIHTFHNSEFSL
jgi:hypothetical protein